MGVLVAVGLGVVLLAVAAIWDRNRERKTNQRLSEAPDRGSDDVNQFRPAYLTQDEVDRMPLPAGPGKHKPQAPDVKLGFGHAGAEFATDGDQAIWRDIAILTVVDQIEAMRALLGPIAAATTQRPLVIAAPDFDPEVLATLRANRIALQAPIVAVAQPLEQLAALMDATGATAVGYSDLMAGYLPAQRLGYAKKWVSTTKSIALWQGDLTEPAP